MPGCGLAQISPGKVDHDVLYGLDFVLDEARIHGFKVIISLVDNWKYPGGVDEYVDWSKSAPKRKQHRPADQSGDFDDQVRQITCQKDAPRGILRTITKGLLWRKRFL